MPHTLLTPVFEADRVLAAGSSVRDEAMHTSLGLLQPLKLNTLWQWRLLDSWSSEKIVISPLLKTECIDVQLKNLSFWILQFGISGPVTDVL